MSAAISEQIAAITTFAELRTRARELDPKRVGVVLADDDVALTCASDALIQGIASPVLIGDPDRIRRHAEMLGLFELVDRADFVASEHTPQQAGIVGVALAREHAVDLLMKGHLRTDEFMHPVLDKQNGLRTGRLVCDIAISEYPSRQGPRLVGLSDAGINPAPSSEQKKQIIRSAIEVLHCLGIARPKICLLSALEVVNPAIPSTGEAHDLTEFAATGAFGEADVYGPLALDGALLEWAARAKGVTHPVAGHADFLVVPNIEAGNILAKSIIFLAQWQFAHVALGAAVPLLITSRVESAQDKVNSIALGVLYAAR
jgi:phosphate butyryltransferase